MNTMWIYHDDDDDCFVKKGWIIFYVPILFSARIDYYIINLSCVCKQREKKGN
jgi:hypothetical protein